MFKVPFDNIDADELIVEFLCSCGRKIEIERIMVPKLDYNLSHAIEATKYHCDHCGEDYIITIENDDFSGYVTIDNIDSDCENVQVHEIPYPPHGAETILFDTWDSINRLKEIVQGADSLNNEAKQYLYLLLLTNIVSTIDAYIKIKTLPIIKEDSTLLRCFIHTFNLGNKTTGIQEQKQKLDIFFSKLSFQSSNMRNKLFNHILGIEINNKKDIEQAILLRHTIIHRNSIDEKGFKHRISKDMLLKLIDSAAEYITSIDKALLEYQTEKFTKRLLNT